eukprot:TRINITY_DN68110_c6_g14_i2.p1 TRINITY_DN68110_c6_g14~~TRINITY_DN68110_c6_g14_i2.p1  ORF type:complete len:594 (+),score=67.69 TRINITY_DN68110_c6_g14_i2:106-1887(+)
MQDMEEALPKMKEYFSGYFDQNRTAAALVPEIKLLFQQGEDGTRQFLNCSPSTPTQYHLVDALLDTDQQVTPDRLFTLDDVALLGDLEFCQREVETLTKLEGYYAPSLKLTVNRLHNKLKLAYNGCKDTKINTAEIGRALVPATEVLFDVLSRPPVTSFLIDLNQTIKELNQRLQELDDQREEAAMSGEMALVEANYYSKIEVGEQLPGLMNEKLKLLDDESSWMKRMSTAIQDRKALITLNLQRLQESNLAFQSQIEQDLQRLNAHLKVRLDQEHNRESNYKAALDDLDKWFVQNTKEQNKLWTDIAALETKVKQLGQDRIQHLQKRVQLRKDDLRNEAEFAGFMEYANTRKRTLQVNISTCEAFTRCHNIFAEAIRLAADGTVAALAKINEDELTKTKDEAKLEYFGHFRELYLTIGDLIYKKERVCDEVDQHLESADLQFELTSDSSDPMAKRHAQDKAAARAIQKDLKTEILMLSKKAKELDATFQPIQAYLTSKGLMPKHPADELFDQNLEKRKRLLEVRELLRPIKSRGGGNKGIQNTVPLSGVAVGAQETKEPTVQTLPSPTMAGKARPRDLAALQQQPAAERKLN